MNTLTDNVLQNNIYLTLSTIASDGSPWATPVHYAYDDKNVYWFSFDAAVHSVNIARDPRVFITIFSTLQNPEVLEDRTALYIATTARQLTGDDEQRAQDIFADRIQENRPLGENAHFYSASIGELDSEKTKENRLYYREKAQ